MDTRDGNIIANDELQKIMEHMDPKEREHFKEMKLPMTHKQEITKKVGRNDPCPCGSGKKFKKCCLE